ncbi:MAG: sulfate/molybdate ABC transporter ATP-binding protein [Syntrophomonadaceae bacterium]|nr:sulfate/molybdate ABC transporter ATP-binding protein [Syntrophomonadaceae bacterium]
MELNVAVKKKLPGFTLEARFDTSTDVVGLLGASGAGKSMTLRCIAGLVKPDEGRIVLNGRVLFDSRQGIDLPSRQRRVGFLFQNYALFPNMTVAENIALGLQNMDKLHKKAKIEQMIALNKLEGLENRYPSQLSGGQQQRAALARALAVEPEALLLDEPFSALDEHLRLQIMTQLLDLLRNYQGVTVFVTHNITEAYRMCQKLVVMSNGQVEVQGPKEELFRKPATLAAARLTGCKNISPASYVSPHELEATAWGIRLQVEEELNPSVHYVGMRANYIKLAADTEQENVFPCWPVFTSETPFRMNIYLALGKASSNQNDYHLQWEVSKEEWADLQNHPLPWRIRLHPEKIFTIL